jgi:hypothetical protein
MVTWYVCMRKMICFGVFVSVNFETMPRHVGSSCTVLLFKRKYSSASDATKTRLSTTIKYSCSILLRKLIVLLRFAAG